MRLKKVKNASEIMASGKYYVENPKDYCGKWAELFGNDNPIYIEVGMGKGQFIMENALKYPHINFIGIEKFDSVIARAIQKTNDIEVNNLRLIRIDAIDLTQVFNHEIDIVYLNFSDPWPKEKHAKRRLTSPRLLDVYDHIFKASNHIIMKTDNTNLFNYSLETLESHNYQIIFHTYDWNIWAKDNIRTEYEEKFSSQGIKIKKLEAIKEQPKNSQKRV